MQNKRKINLNNNGMLFPPLSGCQRELQMENCWWRCGKISTVVIYWWETKLVWPFQGHFGKNLRKIKISLKLNPEISVSGTFPTDMAIKCVQGYYCSIV